MIAAVEEWWWPEKLALVDVSGVDRQRHAGDVARRVGHQQGHGVGDVLGLNDIYRQRVAHVDVGRPGAPARAIAG